MTREASSNTHYQTLRIHTSASQAEIKTAYHRVLLASHPDKKKSAPVSNVNGLSEDFDIARIQDAYRVLANPDARAEYDASLTCTTNARVNPSGPRPAQVISLEEFSEESIQSRWTYVCRCGGVYVITEEDMESDRHLIACERCSEVIYVGYEVVEEEKEEYSARE